jgi:GT2 family glycosyltransferase
MGALCYAMPRDAVEEMVRLPLVQSWKGGVKQRLPGHHRKALDAFAGHAMAALERKVFFYTHSMCEHYSPRGNQLGNSAVGNGNNVGFRREFARVQERPVDHFSAPWVTWDCRGEQRFSTPRPDRIGPVAVIVPGYGLPEVTMRCLDALAESTIDFRLVYVDNGSEPEDFERVKQHVLKHFRRTTIIRSHMNRGFTWAVNEGLKLFQGYHCLILNNDCRVEPQTIETLATHLEWHPQVASVAPLTNDKGACSLRRQAIRLAAGPTGRRLRVVPMSVLPWFCAMLHRDAIKIVPQLPDAAEVSSGLAVDDWWSRQLSARGWRHLLCCDTFAEHDHATTFRAAGINRRQEQRKAARWLQKQ